MSFYEEKKILKSRIWDDNFKEILFKNLIKYKKKSLIIWCFLQCNYYLNQYVEKSTYNEELINNMNFIISKGTIFEKVDDIYQSSNDNFKLFPVIIGTRTIKIFFKKDMIPIYLCVQI